MSTLVYACITAAGMVFSDRPCERPAEGMTEQNALAFAAIQETPPRIPEGWGMDPAPGGVYVPRWSRWATYPSTYSFRRVGGAFRGRR